MKDLKKEFEELKEEIISLTTDCICFSECIEKMSGDVAKFVLSDIFSDFCEHYFDFNYFDTDLDVFDIDEDMHYRFCELVEKRIIPCLDIVIENRK